MVKTCSKCSKSVYQIEELKCLDKIWHKTCFRCAKCNMLLTMKNYKGYDKMPYCIAHYPKTKATQVDQTPELTRIAHNTKIQSQIKYHEDFEKNIKGNKTEFFIPDNKIHTINNYNNNDNINNNNNSNNNNNNDEEEDTSKRDSESLAYKKPTYGRPHVLERISSLNKQTEQSPSQRCVTHSTVYSSDGSKVQSRGELKRIGSISDYDPVNENYGSLARGYHPVSRQGSEAVEEEIDEGLEKTKEMGREKEKINKKQEEERDEMQFEERKNKEEDSKEKEHHQTQCVGDSEGKVERQEENKTNSESFMEQKQNEERKETLNSFHDIHENSSISNNAAVREEDKEKNNETAALTSITKTTVITNDDNNNTNEIGDDQVKREFENIEREVFSKEEEDKEVMENQQFSNEINKNPQPDIITSFDPLYSKIFPAKEKTKEDQPKTFRLDEPVEEASGTEHLKEGSSYLYPAKETGTSANNNNTWDQQSTTDPPLDDNSQDQSHFAVYSAKVNNNINEDNNINISDNNTDDININDDFKNLNLDYNISKIYPAKEINNQNNKNEVEKQEAEDGVHDHHRDNQQLLIHQQQLIPDLVNNSNKINIINSKEKNNKDDEEEIVTTPLPGKWIALYDFEAQDEDEVSFQEGDFIVSMEMIDDGWYLGTLEKNNAKGMIPSNYVKKVD